MKIWLLLVFFTSLSHATHDSTNYDFTVPIFFSSDFSFSVYTLCSWHSNTVEKSETKERGKYIWTLRCYCSGRLTNVKMYSTIELFGFALAALCLKRSCTTVNSWLVTGLTLMLNHSLITLGVLVVVLPWIPCYVCSLLCSVWQWWLPRSEYCCNDASRAC